MKLLSSFILSSALAVSPVQKSQASYKIDDVKLKFASNMFLFCWERPYKDESACGLADALKEEWKTKSESTQEDGVDYHCFDEVCVPDKKQEIPVPQDKKE